MDPWVTCCLPATETASARSLSRRLTLCAASQIGYMEMLRLCSDARRQLDRKQHHTDRSFQSPGQSRRERLHSFLGGVLASPRGITSDIYGTSISPTRTRRAIESFWGRKPQATSVGQIHYMQP